MKCVRSNQMRCVRSNQIGLGEIHSCFYCGKGIPATTEHCQVCGYMKCPSCGICRCNLLEYEKNTLDYIHTNYCQNIDKLKNFNKIVLENWMSKRIIGNMATALKYCKEKVNANIPSI